MAFPWQALATGGSGVLGPLISGLLNKAENRKGREHDEKMYQLGEDNEWEKWRHQNDRDDMTWNRQNEYNERMWHMMNNYNSPQAQMERYKEAGLNPNLIYGQSNTTSPIATSNVGRSSIGKGQLNKTAPHQWPTFDLNSGLLAYAQFKESSARTNNLEAQNKVLQQEAVKKSVETASIAAGTEGQYISNKHSQFRFDLDSQLRQTSVDAAEANLRKVQTDTAIAEARNTREAQLQPHQVEKMQAEIQELRQRRMTNMQQQELNELELNLKRNGVQPTDPLYWRMIMQGLKQAFDIDLNSVLEYVKP